MSDTTRKKQTAPTELTLPAVPPGKVRVPVKNRMGMYVDVSPRLAKIAKHCVIFEDQNKEIRIRDILHRPHLLSEFEEDYTLVSMIYHR